jgi:hypothetical protein
MTHVSLDAERTPCRHAHWESEAAVADGMCPICLAAEIERLRAERDDLMKANALLHALIDNREAEIERLRAALKEIQNNGYRAALCHAVAKTALEQKSP